MDSSKHGLTGRLGIDIMPEQLGVYHLRCMGVLHEAEIPAGVIIPVRQHITFAEGELVRLWGVQRSSGGDAGKLKLRNGVYIVTAKRNDLYDLRHAT